MPRGGYKRLRPRRRRSCSSAANASNSRHRIRSNSDRREITPSISSQRQRRLPVGQEVQQNNQQPCIGDHLRDEVVSEGTQFQFPPWKEEYIPMAAATPEVPVESGHRSSAPAAVSTHSSANSADTGSFRCSPPPSATSSEAFPSSPVPPTDQLPDADACTPDAADAASSDASSADSAAVPAASGKSIDSNARSTSFEASVSGNSSLQTVLVSSTVTVTRNEGAPPQSSSVTAAVGPAAAVGASQQSTIETLPAVLGAAAPETAVAASRTHFPAPQGTSAGNAPQSTESSFHLSPAVLDPQLLHRHSRATPQVSCSDARKRDPGDTASSRSTRHTRQTINSLATEDEESTIAHTIAGPESAPEMSFSGAGGDAAVSISHVSETRGAAVSRALSVDHVCASSSSRYIVSSNGPSHRRSTDTPLLSYVEAMGTGRAVRKPLQKAAALMSATHRRVSRCTAATAFPGTSDALLTTERRKMSDAENRSSPRLVCSGDGAAPPAAQLSVKEDTQDLLSSSRWFQSACPLPTSPTHALPLRSFQAVDGITTAARSVSNVSAGTFSSSTSPAAAASGAPSSVAGGAALSVDGGRDQARSLPDVHGPFAFVVGKSVRQSDRTPKVRDTEIPALLGDTLDNTVHPMSLLLQQQQTPGQRSRRLPVLKIAGGNCQRLLLQTPELLKLVHCHNPRGALEDAVDGALKLRDLRQVVGRRTMQRPSVEVRRNCVLVNLPFVRAILLYQCVVLLPPADFSSEEYSPFAQLKKGTRHQQCGRQVPQQHISCENRHQQRYVWDSSAEQCPFPQHSRQWSQTGPLVGEQQQEARQQHDNAWITRCRQQRPWDQKLAESAEEQLHNEILKRQTQQQTFGAEAAALMPLTESRGLGARAAEHTLLEERQTANDGNNNRSFLSFWTRPWYFFCCRRHRLERRGGGLNMLSSTGSTNDQSDYTFLWGGESGSLETRSHQLLGYRGLPLCDLRDRTRQQTLFYRSHRKVHPIAGYEEERSNSEPVAPPVSPTSILENWLDGGEGIVNVEQQHRLISKLLRITASANNSGERSGNATPEPGTAATTGGPLSGPAECAALEAILEHVCDGLTAELEPIAEAAANVLRVIHEQPSSTRKLRKVADLRRRLDNIKSEARGADDALRSLLDSEDHLRRLEVSRFWGGEDESAEWLRPSRSTNSEDIEILLESYEQELDALLKGIVRTEEALDDALQLMELHLASIRNAFLKSEIALDVIGVLFGGIAAVAGVFGMNIKSGWEEQQNTFWTLAGCLCFLSFVTCCLVYVWFRRQKL